MKNVLADTLLKNLKLKKNINLPLYKQIDDFLRKLILDGTLLPKQKLPSSREFAKQIGVSRITIKSVYEQLLAEGFVQSKIGSGTFVSEGIEIDSKPVFNFHNNDSLNPDMSILDNSRLIRLSEASVRHGTIKPFRPGVPALDLFPVKTWNKYLLDAMKANERNNLSYGDLRGNINLRKSIANHLTNTRGMQVNADQITVTSGAQQAFVIICLVLLKEGDVVWYENPGHIAGRDIMRIMGAKVLSVPIDSEGLEINFAIKNFSKPSLIFTTPSHQHPIGTTMSLARRMTLLKYASEKKSWVIEDDYDSEFRYQGRPLPALSALDSKKRVFYVGTFSKSMFAAIRLGYIVAPSWLTETFSRAKNLLGQNSSAITEHALAKFIEDGRLQEHIRKMRRVYKKRRNKLHECLIRYSFDCLEPQKGTAGMHLLANLRRGIDDKTAHAALLKKGIESLPLSVYCHSPIDRSALVLGFSGVSEKQIPKLTQRAGQILRELK